MTAAAEDVGDISASDTDVHVADDAGAALLRPAAAEDIAERSARNRDGDVLGFRLDAGDHRAAEEAPSAEDVLRDRLLRLQADFDNYRKRVDRERKDWAVYANEKLLKDLLPALDNFDLGLANGIKANAPEALLEGLRLVKGQLESALAKSGVTPIDAEGQPFDPNLHEAITHMPSPDVPEGTVLAQTRRGYMMGDKLLRPVQVVVSSGPAA